MLYESTHVDIANPGRGMMSRQLRITTVLSAIVGLSLLAASPVLARTTANTKDGKPNILVVMTDDQAVSDLQAMPNLASLVAAKGVKFTNAVDSFPLCCPSRATFITGQYSHNHGVGGNFWPYGWYGMTNRANTLPKWLQNSGYYTALVGKWLNGYGSGKTGNRDAEGHLLVPGGEIPVGFNNWNGALDVSAYDYFNFTINQNGKAKTWGDSSYAKKLIDFANIQVKQNPRVGSNGWSRAELIANSNAIFGAYSSVDPSTYGTQVSTNYSPDVTAGISNTIIKAQAKSKKPFFLWWSPASPHREDVDGGIRNGYRDGGRYKALTSNKHLEDTSSLSKLVKDPRPAPRYENTNWDWTQISSKPNFDAPPTGHPLKQQLIMANPLSTFKKAQLEADYKGRLGSVKAVDDGIKTLIATLKSTKQLTNTIVLFTSDNGWMQGEHRVPGDKYLPYEESIRVPLVMSGPGIPAGNGSRTVSTLVTNVDFAATLLDAAGATAGRSQDGTSLLGAAKGTSTLAARSIGLEANAPLFADATMPQQWDQPYRGVRTDRWKFIVWGTGNMTSFVPSSEEELYDLQNDPFELHNLASDSAYAATKEALRVKLVALQSCVGASCRSVTQ
ncbi:MAG: sulfatase-like hydrolase/transferase [Actinobacteria bacterium]|nr:sulfatase-like hydrolase/transferase [Actinomycetota bacterium]